VTVIEDGAFIGSDTTLVAPVRIGQGAYIAAGSSITDAVPADSLALGRARQAVKEGWAKQRKERNGAVKERPAPPRLTLHLFGRFAEQRAGGIWEDYVHPARVCSVTHQSSFLREYSQPRGPAW